MGDRQPRRGRARRAATGWTRGSRRRPSPGSSPSATRNAETGARRARAAALLLLALPGSAYIYQGEELGLPEVTGIPGRRAPAIPEVPPHPQASIPAATAAACPSPGPAPARASASPERMDGASPAAPWLPQPPDWGEHSVESQLTDEHSFLSLYRAALRLRRGYPALGRGTLRWLDAAAEHPGLLCFAREPGLHLRRQLRRGAGAASRAPGDPARQRTRPRRQPAARHRHLAVQLTLSVHSASIQAIALPLRSCQRYGCHART